MTLTDVSMNVDFWVDITWFFHKKNQVWRRYVNADILKWRNRWEMKNYLCSPFVCKPYKT